VDAKYLANLIDIRALRVAPALPFADPTSFGGDMDFETVAYASQKARIAA
jgi:hypothetical protein